MDRAQAGGARLGLAGVPIGIKASEGLDSVQTRRLLAAGCVPIGATSATAWQTWGHTDRGPTVNPYHCAWSPGGSSAGSAVAVAAGIVPLATGSDGAGSIRIPAAWCGVVGLKPTTGLLPARDRAGLTIGGPLTRHAGDVAAYLTAVGAAAEDGAVPLPARPLVAWSATLGFADTQPEIAAVAAGALRRLADCVQLIDVRVQLRDPTPAWQALRAARPQRQQIQAARSLRRDNDDALRRLFGRVDLLATPTTPNPPHGHDGPGTAMSVALTWAFNLSGHPAISIAAGFTPAGAPVGVQLVARPGADQMLVAVATDAQHRLGSTGPARQQ